MRAGEEIVRCYRPALTSQQSIQLHIFSTEDDVSDNLKVNISLVLIKRSIYCVFKWHRAHSTYCCGIIVDLYAIIYTAQEAVKAAGG